MKKKHWRSQGPPTRLENIRYILNSIHLLLVHYLCFKSSSYCSSGWLFINSIHSARRYFHTCCSWSCTHVRGWQFILLVLWTLGTGSLYLFLFTVGSIDVAKIFYIIWISLVQANVKGALPDGVKSFPIYLLKHCLSLSTCIFLWRSVSEKHFLVI